MLSSEGPRESLRVLGLFKQMPSEANLRAFEKDLEDSSKVADWLALTRTA